MDHVAQVAVRRVADADLCRWGAGLGSPPGYLPTHTLCTARRLRV